MFWNDGAVGSSESNGASEPTSGVAKEGSLSFRDTIDEMQMTVHRRPFSARTFKRGKDC